MSDDQTPEEIISAELVRHRDMGGWPLHCKCAERTFDFQGHVSSRVQGRLLSEGFKIVPASHDTIEHRVAAAQEGARRDIMNAPTDEANTWSTAYSAALEWVLKELKKGN